MARRRDEDGGLIGLFLVALAVLAESYSQQRFTCHQLFFFLAFCISNFA
jgi:hypothetical protein